MFQGQYHLLICYSGCVSSGTDSIRERPILMTTLHYMDMALADHVITRKLVSDADECARICFDTFNCVSFNLEYAAEGMKTCELSRSTKEMAELSFVKRLGFVYYG